METKTKRIIPCLDVDHGRVVKGKKFKSLKDIADPVELARKYERQGADELVFYDITATTEKRGIFLDIVKQVRSAITIPLTVGGGIRTVKDIEAVLQAGADKVSINSAAVKHPDLITEAASRFGNERIVLSFDAKKVGKREWKIFTDGGLAETELMAVDWAREGEKRGAGEIVVNCMDEDGVRNGYEIELTEMIAKAVDIPVIASGGAGEMKHFKEVFERGISGALAASVFHYDDINITDLKLFLAGINFPEDGLLPAIVQDVDTKDVLMLAYMNEAALRKAIETKEAWFFSRSRQELWHKGATSGNKQVVRGIQYDCDGDAILLQVKRLGPACHTGEESCFFKSLIQGSEELKKEEVLSQLVETIKERQNNLDSDSYTAYLFREGLDKMLKKIGEESSEVIIGAKNRNKQEVIWEIADLVYHMLVLMTYLDIDVKDIKQELKKRHVKREG
ncbi:MAG TPA: imidazole glycerol phosphate synthase subunit HisF [Cerasibacillus sp.]|uniref:imidazole glycerol phosphate synthase subunit HisF n=1 Tax=Cerasibacillus sp. TaxID=2498711 RepID=UPI002F41F910